MDDRLRFIQRRGALSGSPDDEAQLLVERVRAGEIREDQLLIAAATGVIPAACAIIGRSAEQASSAYRRILTAPSRDLFPSIIEQMKVVWRLNQRYGWGFTDTEFLSLPVPTTWPSRGEQDLIAMTLVPYLDTVGDTFEVLWRAIESRHRNTWRWDALKSDPANLKLLDGITHPGKCLRWEAIDLAANWNQENGINPRDVRDPSSSPHAGILAAAVLHTRWVKAMDGTTVPFVWIPGYQFCASSRWSRVPWLGFFGPGSRVQLFGYDEEIGHETNDAVPVFVESPPANLAT